MSCKSGRIAELARPFEGRALDARYLAYFDCFNRRQFFEAHEVLEDLWLSRRQSPEGAFYKGLIQLAGAFVHLQKGRPGPALALFRLAQSSLKPFPAAYQALDLCAVGAIIREWSDRVAAVRPGSAFSLEEADYPRLLSPVGAES